MGPWTSSRTHRDKPPEPRKHHGESIQDPVAALAARPLATAVGAAAIVASFAATFELGGFGLVAGGYGVTPAAGLLAAAGMGSFVVTVAALLGAAAVVLLGRSRGTSDAKLLGLGEKINQEATHPLLSPSHAAELLGTLAAPRSAARRTDLQGADPKLAGDDASRDVGHVADEEAPVVPPDPFQGKRRRLLDLAAQRVRGWAAALALGGVEVTVDGELRRLRLEPPGWRALLLEAPEWEPDQEPEEPAEEVPPLRLPLLKLGLRLEPPATLVLVTGFGSNERKTGLVFEDYDTCAEVAVALKALRGSADGGAGISEWLVDRPPDSLGPPPPAE